MIATHINKERIRSTKHIGVDASFCHEEEIFNGISMDSSAFTFKGIDYDKMKSSPSFLDDYKQQLYLPIEIGDNSIIDMCQVDNDFILALEIEHKRKRQLGGIYFLWFIHKESGEGYVYIGESNSVYLRIQTHKSDFLLRNWGAKDWHQFDSENYFMLATTFCFINDAKIRKNIEEKELIANCEKLFKGMTCVNKRANPKWTDKKVVSPFLKPLVMKDYSSMKNEGQSLKDLHDQFMELCGFKFFTVIPLSNNKMDICCIRIDSMIEISNESMGTRALLPINHMSVICDVYHRDRRSANNQLREDIYEHFEDRKRSSSTYRRGDILCVPISEVFTKRGDAMSEYNKYISKEVEFLNSRIVTIHDTDVNGLMNLFK